MNLKICPFCGADAKLKEYGQALLNDENLRSKSYFSKISCTECDAEKYNIGDTQEEATQKAIKEWNKRPTFDSKKAAVAQELLCKKGPCFAPHDGICYRCGLQIYAKITVEEAGRNLITSCPHCNYSYCD